MSSFKASEMSAENIQQFATYMQENPKLQAQFNALLGIKGDDVDTPAPSKTTAPSSSATITASVPTGINAGKTSTEKDQATDLNATPRLEVSQASDILSLVKDLNVPRRVRNDRSQFVPNASALFYVLHEMDRFATKKFKVRRALLTLSPAHNAFYFTFLFNVQVARCMMYNNTLTELADIDALNSLLSMYPPEKFHIPAPLLPFFKAITTYKVQNELYGRVSPKMPFLLPSGDSSYSHIATSQNGLFYPIPAMVLSMLENYHSDLQTVDEKKLAEKFTAIYPFEWKDSNDHSAGYKSDLTLAGHVFSKTHTNWSAAAAAQLVNPALRYRFPYNKDLVSNLKDLLEDYTVPSSSGYDNKDHSLANILIIKKMAWIRTWLAPMASYASIWPGSGTLADCSLDGPAAGAYIARYQPSETAPVAPTKPFDPASRFTLETKLTTTQGSHEPIAERMAALTQIHARPASDFWYTGNTAQYSRSGNVWLQGPVYGPSNSDMTMDSLSEAIPRYLEPRLAQ